MTPSISRGLGWMVALLLCLSPTAHAETPARSEKGVNLYLAGAGLLLLAGGGALAYHHHRAADRDMDVYRGSAFTDNTREYRDRVEEHEAFTWAGLAGAVLGGVVLVVAF